MDGTGWGEEVARQGVERCWREAAGFPLIFAFSDLRLASLQTVTSLWGIILRLAPCYCLISYATA